MDPEDQIRLLEPLSTKWIQNHAKASRDTVAAWRRGRAPRDDQWRRFIGAYNRWLRGTPATEEEPPPDWAGAMEERIVSEVLVNREVLLEALAAGFAERAERELGEDSDDEGPDGTGDQPPGGAGPKPKPAT